MTDITVARDESFLTITLNRPEARNALNEAMVTGLRDALDLASRDLSIRAVILTGAGDAFCSGADTRSISREEGAFSGKSAPRTRHSYTHGVQTMSRAFYACEVPIIAAVNGPAIGLGFDLTTQADIRIASETATFSEAFVTVGLIPGDGGFWYLPRIVGFSRAVEMTVTGRRIDAATAERWGLVSQVVRAADVMVAARELAEEIAARPPHTVRLSKRLIRDGMDCGLDAALSMGAMAQAALTGSADQREAVAALMGRRPAAFTAA